jgi:hypothetical protein
VVALRARDHRIGLADASALTKAYRDANVSAVKAGAIAEEQVVQLPHQTAHPLDS